MTGFANPSAQQVVALIMGGTWNPLPDPVYLENVNLVVHPAALPRGQSAGPIDARAVLAGYPRLGNETFGTSVAQGVSLLDAGIKAQLALDNKVVVFGYSQSATIATDEIRHLHRSRLAQYRRPVLRAGR